MCYGMLMATLKRVRQLNIRSMGTMEYTEAGRKRSA